MISLLHRPGAYFLDLYKCINTFFFSPKMQSFLMLKGTVHVATTVLQSSFTSCGPQATVNPHEPFSNWSVRINTLFFSLKQYICYYMTNFLTVPGLCVCPSFLFLLVFSFYSVFHIFFFCFFFYFLFCY